VSQFRRRCGRAVIRSRWLFIASPGRLRPGCDRQPWRPSKRHRVAVPVVTRSTLPGNVRPLVQTITSGNGSRALGIVSQLGGVAFFVVIGSAQAWRRRFPIHRSGKRSRRCGSIVAAGVVVSRASGFSVIGNRGGLIGGGRCRGSRRHPIAFTEAGRCRGCRVSPVA
jgi:hypothetical protein